MAWERKAHVRGVCMLGRGGTGERERARRMLVSVVVWGGCVQSLREREEGSQSSTGGLGDYEVIVRDCVFVAG